MRVDRAACVTSTTGRRFAVWQAERLLGLIARTSSCQIRMDPSFLVIIADGATFAADALLESACV